MEFFDDNKALGKWSLDINKPISELIREGIEFVELEGRISREEFVKSIDIWRSSTGEGEHELKPCRSMSTQRTWDYIDCLGMSSVEVYKELVSSSGIKREFDDYEREVKCVLYKSYRYRELKYGSFFECNGLLFIDNLLVYEKDAPFYFDRLAKIIKNKEDFESDLTTSFAWLVVYTSGDPERFPKGFRGQFTEIPLETKISLDPKTNTININKVARRVPDREFLIFQKLNDNKGKRVDKDDLLKEINETDEGILFKLIYRLGETFKGCPIEIENIKKSNYKESGYMLIY